MGEGSRSTAAQALHNLLVSTKNAIGALGCQLFDSRGLLLASTDQDQRLPSLQPPLRIFVSLDKLAKERGLGELHCLVAECDKLTWLTKRFQDQELILSVAFSNKTPLGLVLLELDSFEGKVLSILGRKGGDVEEEL